MKNYVITCGTDCDGAFSASLDKYTSEELAEKAAKHSMEGTDGILYWPADEQEAKRFAETYLVNMPNYAFDENNEIVDDPPPHTEADIPPDYEQLAEEDEPRPDGERLLDGDAWSGGFADNH
jgi:hypothetical protein